MFGVCAMQWGKPMRAGIVLSAQFCQPLTIKKTKHYCIGEAKSRVKTYLKTQNTSKHKTNLSTEVI